MTATTRLSGLDPHRRRVLVILAVAVALVAVSIPVGLWAARGGLPTTTSVGDTMFPGSAGGGSVGERQAVTPAAPGMADGSKVGAPDSAGRDGAAPPDSAAAPVVVDTKIARSAWLGMKVGDLTSSSAKARAIAQAAGGQVLSENVVTGADPTGAYGWDKPEVPRDRPVPPAGVNEARLTLSVPADKLDGVLTELTTLGTVSYRSSSSQDVTDTYVDTQARIQPAKDSIARVRALLAKATSLEQIVLLESELSRRQADLDSLQQRLAELNRRTTTSDVSVTLWTDATAPVAPGDNSFLAGLKSAWNALLGSVMVVVTGLAVLLPWLLLGLVITWFVRRWLRSRPASKPDTGSGPAPATD